MELKGGTVAKQFISFELYAGVTKESDLIRSFS